ncbi:hypothetical protein BDF20DRAFT_80671 [Mycotypha africana]|uniref:uncharacterized protein n=1 Tax=Mycotypha africana TaxID=64632 RepID=UPI002301B865|nr:uncharacterized protein BDF20DRAFT_80671 [Mycotypha africana]KAI8992000.1 hypothetical protein BDF20DRAFT_80671 [Mycotypha africana]
MLIISPILRKQALISKRQQASSILQPLRRWNHTNTSAAVTTTTDIVPDDPIHRVDLRVGKIVDIKDHPEAKHLFIEQGQLYEQIYGIAQCMKSKAVL